MNRLLVALVFGILHFALTNSATAGSVEEDVMWCLEGSANNTLSEQPYDKGYCTWLRAGSAVGVWYGQAWAAVIWTGTQKSWARQAAQMSCSQNGPAIAAAVGLIAACQCHNAEAADRVIDNAGEVIYLLQKYAGCPQEGFRTTEETPAPTGPPPPPPPNNCMLTPDNCKPGTYR